MSSIGHGIARSTVVSFSSLSQQADSREPRRDELSVFEIPGAEIAMRKMRKLFVCVACAAVLVITSGSARAQYGVRGRPLLSRARTTTSRLAYSLWYPGRDIKISSESLGIIGTTIDAVTDLGFQHGMVQGFKVVLSVPPLNSASGTRPSSTRGHDPHPHHRLQRAAVHRRPAGDVRAGLEGLALRDGYDFIARPRGFAGFIFEGRYTDINMALAAPSSMSSRTSRSRSRPSAASDASTSPGISPSPAS